MPKLNTSSDGGAYVNTTDATQTTAATFQTQTDKMYEALVRVNALATSTFGFAYSSNLRGLFLNDGGTLAQIGVTQAMATTLASSAISLASATLDASGTEIRARVTGVAATPITWNVDAEIKEIGNYIAEGGLT